MRHYELTVNGNDYNVLVNDFSDNTADITVNNQAYKVKLKHATPVAVEIKEPKKTAVPKQNLSQYTPTLSVAGTESVVAPIPGVIIDVHVAVGDTVNANDALLTLEAMKMENSIKSPVSGTIKAIYVSNDAAVNYAQELLVIETA